MPMRVVALFLSFVLLWSGLTTVEQSLDAAVSPAHATTDVVMLPAPGPAPGSVEHHHLDDLPSQALGDPPIETFGLLPSSPAQATRMPQTARPRAFVASTVASPCLAGPLRPPCALPRRG